MEGQRSTHPGPVMLDRGCFLCAALLAVSGALVSSAAGAAQSQERAFETEMARAKQARDRDSRVKHLRKALALRPGHPDNIRIEHRIVVQLGQVRDWVHGQRPRPYKHMDYYESWITTGSSSPQMLMPRTAILAGCMCSAMRRPTQARKHLWHAMTYLESTWARRKRDWLTAPEPRRVLPGPPITDDEASVESDRRMWRRLRKMAEAGECLGDLEMGLAKAAVRQYGYTFGPHKGQEVAVPMLAIIRGFPGTPMARIAQEHIDRGTALTLTDVLRVVPPGEVADVIPLEAQPTPGPERAAWRKGE